MPKLSSNKQRSVDFLIVFLTIFSVSPFINTITNNYLLLVLLFVILVSLRRKKEMFSKRTFATLIIFYCLLLIQAIIYDGFSMAIIYIPLITFYLPFLIYKLVGISFFNFFIKIIYGITLITTPIWILQSVSPVIDQYLRNASEMILEYSWSNAPRSLLFYTTAWSDNLINNTVGLYRNSGAFHEPGAYGIFLNIAIIINTFINGKLLSRKNILFIFCLLTTFSTAGYITFFVIMISYLVHLKINIGIKVVLFSAFVLTSFFVYQSGDFLQAKVEEQYSDQTYNAANKLGRFEGYSGRFYAFFTSLNLFMEHPVVGRGILYATSEKASGEMNASGSYTYGFMGVLSRYGIFFGIFYLFYFFKGFYLVGKYFDQNKLFIVGCFVAINLALMTQVFITTIFITFLFTIGRNAKEKLLGDILRK